MDMLQFVDMERICRVCMCSDQELFLIHDGRYADDETTIAQMLSECTRYKVERFDELPEVICLACMTAVRNAFHLKRNCEKTYRKLVELLSSRSSNTNCAGKQLSDMKLDTILAQEKSTQTDDSTMYPCERCDEKFFTFDALKNHRENEHKGSAIVCRFCTKAFNRIGYLKTHIAVFHPETGYTSHNQCHICQKQFTRREHMRRHMAIIHKSVEITNETVNGHIEQIEQIENNGLQQIQIEFAMANTIPAADNSDLLGKEKLLEHDMEQPIELANVLMENDVYELNGLEKSTDIISIDNSKKAENEDDEDEKPLSNFLNSNTAKAFIEVLFNENNSGEYKLNECIENTIKNEPEKKITSIEDTHAKSVSIKRARGRPPRKPKLSQPPNTVTEKGDLHKCDNCDMILPNRAVLLNHMKRHIKTEDRKFPCVICSENFATSSCLRKHLKSMHEATKSIKCDKCDKVCTHITQYKRHTETKHSDKIHKCNICLKAFTTKMYLQRHLSIHGKKRFICKECSESYVTKEELNAHIKAEGHDKPMLCPECGLRCKTSNILMVHMRRHKGEKPFKCKFCGKGFPRMDDLRVHEKYHTGEKSHFCDTCGKGFQRKYNLTIHLRVHTGEKPYKCPHCPQAFAQGNDLKAHIRRHTGERFRCEICNAAFLQGYQIRQHKLIDHGIKEIPPTQRVKKFVSVEEQEQQIKQNLQQEIMSQDFNAPQVAGGMFENLSNLTTAITDSTAVTKTILTATDASTFETIITPITTLISTPALIENVTLQQIIQHNLDVN